MVHVQLTDNALDKVCSVMYLPCQRLAIARKCIAKGSVNKKNLHYKENKHVQLKAGILRIRTTFENVQNLIQNWHGS